MLSPAKVGRYAFLGFDCCRVWEELARALRRACRSGEILWCVSANPSFSGMHASEGACVYQQSKAGYLCNRSDQPP